MHHVIFLVKRNPALSQEEFARYWIDEHTPLTASVAGVRSYECYPAHPGNEGSPFDGVAVLGFDDEAAANAAMASPEFQLALADAPNFQDVETTTSINATLQRIV